MNVLMPQLGETVAEGKITQWFKSAGDPIKPGDNLFEIETDKVSMEVPATTAGVLAEIRVRAGEIVPVGTVVAVVSDGTGGESKELPTDSVQLPQQTPAPASGYPGPLATAMPEAAPSAVVPLPSIAGIKLDPFFEVRTPARNYGPARLASGIAVTPLARRLAADSAIDLSRVKGSGPHGRIVARDIEAASVDSVFACGTQMAALWDALPEFRRGAYGRTSQDIAPHLTAALHDGDVVLVKGSLGSRMAVIINALRSGAVVG